MSLHMKLELNLTGGQAEEGFACPLIYLWEVILIEHKDIGTTPVPRIQLLTPEKHYTVLQNFSGYHDLKCPK